MRAFGEGQRMSFNLWAAAAAFFSELAEQQERAAQPSPVQPSALDRQMHEMQQLADRVVEQLSSARRRSQGRA